MAIGRSVAWSVDFHSEVVIHTQPREVKIFSYTFLTAGLSFMHAFVLYIHLALWIRYVVLVPDVQEGDMCMCVLCRASPSSSFSSPGRVRCVLVMNDDGGFGSVLPERVVVGPTAI